MLLTAAAYTLRTAHRRFLKLFAPLLAHVTEELWHDMYADGASPIPEIKGTVQAEKTSGAQEIFLRGCPGMNFKASLPFPGMREAFAAFSKRSQQPPFPILGFLKALK
ncbi:MAG: class I tRNA ligase family protein [Lentisphaeria bacterium]